MKRLLVVAGEAVRNIMKNFHPEEWELTIVAHQEALQQIGGEPFGAVFISVNIPVKEILENAEFTLGDVADAIQQRNPECWFIVHAFEPVHPGYSPLTGLNCVFGDGNLTEKSLVSLLEATQEISGHQAESS